MNFLIFQTYWNLFQTSLTFLSSKLHLKDLVCSRLESGEGPHYHLWFVHPELVRLFLKAMCLKYLVCKAWELCPVASSLWLVRSLRILEISECFVVDSNQDRVLIISSWRETFCSCVKVLCEDLKQEKHLISALSWGSNNIITRLIKSCKSLLV